MKVVAVETVDQCLYVVNDKAFHHSIPRTHYRLVKEVQLIDMDLDFTRKAEVRFTGKGDVHYVVVLNNIDKVYLAE